MNGAFVRYVRWIALKSCPDRTGTHLLPLSKIKKAVVLLDSGDDSLEETVKAARKFFDSHGILFRTICPNHRSVNWYGKLKKEKDPMKLWSEDILISLAGQNSFTYEYAARTSKAKFKVGRYQLGEVFDFVVRDPEGRMSRQLDVFNAVVDYLQKID